MNEPVNPYEPMMISDEEPVEMVRFFRAAPMPRKVRSQMLRDVIRFTFRKHLKEFIGLGLMQVLFIWVPVFTVSWLLVNHPNLVPNLFLTGGILFLLILLAVLIYVASVNASLRFLRKEKMVFFSSFGDAVRFIKTVFNSIVYGLICVAVGVIVTIIISIVSSFPLFLLFGSDSFPEPTELKTMLTIAITLFLTILPVILAGLFLFWFIIRSAIGFHFIIDQNVHCVRAFSCAFRYSRGNVNAIFRASQSPLFFVVILLGTLGAGIVLPLGYHFCWSTAAYLLLTGQGTLLTEEPDEW
ncbi:MAG: hypothetical protein LBQ54_01780 [Planctomycetaceae bacterium]|jgi:hypothetical protein|nr:hypothetical protein [Planctomycetaceae bacterium]